jgi:Zn-finger nucleic acid-binding protein
MKCPRCETSGLDEKDRDGVTVDVCQKCRGIWLDRGELEKLIARALDEETTRDGRRERDEEPDEGRGRFPARARDDEHDGDDVRRGPDGRPRPRRWYESLTDILD